MKLLLIREKDLIYSQSTLSYGLGLLGTLAKDLAKVNILDNNSRYKTYSISQILKAIRNFKPDIIGFNVNTLNILRSSKLTSAISQAFPGICLVAGGLHTYIDPQEVAALGVHIVAKDDADLTIQPLLKALHRHVRQEGKFAIRESLTMRLRAIPGLLFRTEADTAWEDTGPPVYIKDLDSLPFVDYNLFNLDDYVKSSIDTQHLFNYLSTQRGCPFNCGFCMVKPRGGVSNFRQNSAQYRVKYAKYLYEKYRVRHLNFTDSNFTLNKNNTIDFCHGLIKNGLHEKITFFGQTNAVNPLDDELCQVLKEAGCIGIALGIERLSSEALRRIKKNKNYETIKHDIRLLNKYNINITANCLIGFPFDTPETISEEKRLFSKAFDYIKTFSPRTLMPMPGTEVYQQTSYKKWYLDETIVTRKPTFYNLIYDYTINAANPDINWFNLDRQTLKSMREIKEHFFNINIKKMNSRAIDFLYAIAKILARLSFKLSQKSLQAEEIVFFIPKVVFLASKNYLVTKYRRRKLIN